MLDASKRHLSCNMASETVRACLALSESDSNKPHLRGSNLLRLTAASLELFAYNAPRLTVMRSNGETSDFGCGGSDPECAQLCVQLLLQLSFCFPDQREWRSAVEQQCPGLQRVLLVVKNLPPDRTLDVQTELSIKHLLASLDEPSLSQVTPSSLAAAARKHVMLSYSWDAKKELVVALAAGLRAKGVDVWRDEEGSHCVPAMSGSTDDCMAAAVEHSHAIIVCVSRAYKASANCRMEAKYANDMHKRGKVKLVFAMMEQDYTTRSAPEHVDGWLGLMIGDQLWYRMWMEDHVPTVAAAIHGAVSSSASASAAASSASARPFCQAAVDAPSTVSSPTASFPEQPPQLPVSSPLSAAPLCLKRPAHPLELSAKRAHRPPPASPATALPTVGVVAAASPHLQPLSPSFLQAQPLRAAASVDEETSAALATAFECLQDTSKTRDGLALADLLESLGVTCAADLAYIDDTAALSIRALLKPTAANYFAALIGASSQGVTSACFSYLLDATKHIDPAAMTALLQQLGISQPHELRYLDDAQLRGIAALLKPVAAKVFEHMTGFVRRAQG